MYDCVSHEQDIFEPLEEGAGILQTAVDVVKGLKSVIHAGQCRNKQELWRARDRAVFQLMNIAAALKASSTGYRSTLLYAQSIARTPN
eukprot:2875466-Rhodomonas_salina.3